MSSIDLKRYSPTILMLVGSSRWVVYFFNFIFGCAGSLLLCRLSFSCVELGLLSSCHAWASYCDSFSCFRARALRCMGFRSCSTHGLSGCGSLALEHRLSSWGPGALLLQGTWDIPRPGIESVSPALAGGFFPTEPPGKPWYCLVSKLCLSDSCDYNPSGSSVHGFPRQEYWSGLPFPPPRDLPNPWIEPMSPAWWVCSLPLNHKGSPGSILKA